MMSSQTFRVIASLPQRLGSHTVNRYADSRCTLLEHGIAGVELFTCWVEPSRSDADAVASIVAHYYTSKP